MMDLWTADATKRALPSSSGRVSPGPHHETHSTELPTTSRQAHSMNLITSTPSEEKLPTPLAAGTPDGWGYLWGSCDPFDVAAAKKTDTTEPLCTDALQTSSVMSRDKSEDVCTRGPHWTPHARTPAHANTHTNDIVVKIEEFHSSSDSLSSPESDPLLKRKARRTNITPGHEGSDIDSDNDEYDLKMTRDIPHDAELETPIRELIKEAQNAMDDEIDSLVSRDFVWVEDFETFVGKRHDFTGPKPGSIKDYNTPYDAFIDIWSSDIMGVIVEETNRYAKLCIHDRTAKGSIKPTSRVHKWRETDIDELYTLFAVYMYMGIDKRESQAEYWRLNGCLEMPQFKQLMTSSRYMLLNKFLHFVDDCDQKSGEMPAKLRKLASVISHLNLKFSTLYNLDRNISMDEFLTMLNGRVPWSQAIRTKPSRFGIRSHELCESASGYMHQFEIYLGPNSGSLSSHLGRKTVRILLELLKGLYFRGHCVVMDNFYNSPALTRYLKGMGFDCVGPVRHSRKHMPQIPNALNTDKGIIVRHSSDISITALRGDQTLTMISTYNEADLEKPCFKDYHSAVRGIEMKKNQKLSTYLSERKQTIKWYIKVFKRMLNASVHNAFVMLNSSLGRRGVPLVPYREFRYELADGIVRGHRRGPVLVPQTGLAMRLRRDVVHRPRTQSGRSNRRRCYVCYRRGTYKLVHSQCVTCDEYVCFEPCWDEWHARVALHEKERTRKRGRRS